MCIRECVSSCLKLYLCMDTLGTDAEIVMTLDTAAGKDKHWPAELTSILHSPCEL